MTDIGTRRIFNEDHDMFRSMVRKWWEAEVVPHHSKWEEAGEVPRDLWKSAGENGLLCVTMPEEMGGSAADALHAAITWEEQSYTGCTGPGFALHSEIVAPYLLHYGTDEQKAQYLPRMASGDCITAIAMTEPGAGSDLQGIRTTAVQDGDDWILNGSKTFITNGWLCDMVIVVAKTDASAEKAAHGISLFLVDAGTAGFNKGSKLKKLGMKAQDTAELFFDNVRLPSSAILGGKPNQGFYQLMQELQQERLMIADMGVAGSEAAFEWTREYVTERKAFGKSLKKLPTIQFELAEMKTEIAVARAFLDQCLELHNEGRLDVASASMAKYYGSDLQNKIADRGLQLHGGWGFMWEFPISRFYADSRVQPIYGGTNEIMKSLIARTL